MTHEELLRKAYLGEAIPGFIHNIGNPMGALLGFVALIREEAELLQSAVENLPDCSAKKSMQETCDLLKQFLSIAEQSEQSLREILDQFVAKCNKDASNELLEIPLAALVRLEADVLATNRFFKHKIKKQFAYAEEIPSAWGVWRSVSQPVGSILLQYTRALQSVNDPALAVRVHADAGKPEIEFTANVRLTPSEEGMDASFPPVLTLAECTAMLNPLAIVTYITQDGMSSTGKDNVRGKRR